MSQLQSFVPPVKIKGVGIVEYLYEGEQNEFIIARRDSVEERTERFDSFLIPFRVKMRAMTGNVGSDA